MCCPHKFSGYALCGCQEVAHGPHVVWVYPSRLHCALSHCSIAAASTQAKFHAGCDAADRDTAPRADIVLTL